MNVNVILYIYIYVICNVCAYACVYIRDLQTQALSV